MRKMVPHCVQRVFISLILGQAVSGKIRLQKHKTHKQIRYALYRIWTLAMVRANIATDLENPNFAWPTVALNYIRGLLPDDCKREIFENSFPISLDTLLSSNGITKFEGVIGI